MADLKFDANLKWLFTEVDFLERFDAAAAAGFTGVEYAAPYPYKASELKKRLADAGLKQVLINSPTGQPGTPERQGIACMPDKVAQFRDDFTLALEYAVELESDFIHVMAGIRQEGVSRDRAFARFVSNIIWASETAKDTNVRIVLEAQNKRDAPGFILDTQAHAAAVAEAVDRDNVGIMFDVYHAQIDEGDLVPKLQAMLPDVFHVQVADPPRRHEPGTGEVNFRTIFDTIRASGYAGWIGCEYEPIGDTAEGLTWIEELAR
ncbi:MAG: hydroxypyruvate isomerase [Microbacteriaceae bacterium]|jgi:hydroxypyruvate isomerase|nr:hydroxypyruvate isomerase [Microbacteriaceae bacterium]